MKKLKVNLGSGTDYMPGWVNVDAERQYNPDIVADLSKPFPFKDNSVSEVKASDILEHFTKEDGERFLQECYRVLEVGGIITIRTYNIFQIFKQFGKDPYVLIHFLYGNTKETGIFGAHKYAYTEKMIIKTLQHIGFSIQSIDKEQTNFVIVAKKEMQKQRKKLHIAVVQQTPDVGGAETYMKLLIINFLKEATISFATNNEKFLNYISDLSIQKEKIPVVLDIIGNYKGLIKSIIRLPRATYFYTKLLRKYKKQGVDVILMSGFSEKMLVSFLTLFITIPVVWIEHGPLTVIFKRNFLIPKIVYRVLKFIPKYVIVPSKNTMKSITIDCRVSLSKLVEVSDGVLFKNTNTNLRSKFKGKIVIGNVSRLTREKGQDILIQAAQEVVKKKKNVVFLIIGEGPDKKYYTELINSLHLEKSVFLLGYVDNLDAYYNTMDIFIFPTVWDLEGFGMVLAEAMSHKLPIVASNFGPVPEIVTNEVSGILVTPNNPQKLAGAILSLINNPAKMKKLGENGYKIAKEKYNITQNARKILELLYYAAE